MIRNKLGIFMGTACAALGIGIFAAGQPANAAVMNPQIHPQIRPYIALGIGGGYECPPYYAPGYYPGPYVGVDVPLIVGGGGGWGHGHAFRGGWGGDGHNFGGGGHNFRGGGGHGGWRR